MTDRSIAIRNIYVMIAYAFRTIRRAGQHRIATEPFDHLHDLFAEILACGVGAQVKRGHIMPTGLVESPVLRNGHAGFGGRPAETSWPKDQHRAAGRPYVVVVAGDLRDEACLAQGEVAFRTSHKGPWIEGGC